MTWNVRKSGESQIPAEVLLLTQAATSVFVAAMSARGCCDIPAGAELDQMIEQSVRTAMSIVNAARGAVERPEETRAARPHLTPAARAAIEKNTTPHHVRGGVARAAKLTPERRSEIARAAAKKRWSRGAADV
jgi:hypothetical protein